MTSWTDFEDKLHCTAKRRVLASAVVAAVLLLLMDVFVQHVAHVAASEVLRPPIVVHGVWADKPVGPDRSLVINVHRTKVRDCPSTWATFLIAADGTQFPLGTAPGSAVGEGETTIRLFYQVSSYVPDGLYTYTAVGTYLCDGVQIIVRQPETTVQIGEF
jgi:hypothetical protein